MAKKKDFKVNFDTEGTEITTDEEDTITMDDAIEEIDNEEQVEEIPEDWQKLIKAYDSRTFETIRPYRYIFKSPQFGVCPFHYS